MDLESKKLKQVRANDLLIYALLKDPLFRIQKNGEIWSKRNRAGTESLEWHRAEKVRSDGYLGVAYKYKVLNAARIVFAMHGDSLLIAEKVINHKNGNKHDNRIDNLELVTYGENNVHRYRILEGKKAPVSQDRLGRSGKIQSTNDDLIRVLLQDPNYKVLKNGTVLKLVANAWIEAGSSKNKSKKAYWYVKYRYKGLGRNRIIYAKFNGPLAMDLVINHIDGNTLNDSPSNLELITQSANNKHTFRNLGYKPRAGNSKISPEIAGKIRDLQKLGWTNRQLREKFGLSKSTISYVVNNRVWYKEVITY